jgi:7,8-dihydropterin-6-yl-methyl-4-(beta-D-ribofuranosyl)aminobenzene 5'-phosphate synthase
MLSDWYTGEWGFSALIEADDKKVLFDTGLRENTVINNAKELKIDLNNISNVFLSHNHKDHTGGLINLKNNFSDSFSNAHVGDGIFLKRLTKNLIHAYILDNKKEMENLGINFINHKYPSQILPGIWTTGVIQRIHDEKNWSKTGKIIDTNKNIIEDNIPEDQSLFFDTAKGIVLISGCGHAGIINTIEHVKKILPDRPIYMILGGFHVHNLNDSKLKWTANNLKESGVQYFIGAHCTGINSTYKLRKYMGLSSHKALVGSVGTYINNDGVFPGKMQ